MQLLKKTDVLVKHESVGVSEESGAAHDDETCRKKMLNIRARNKAFGAKERIKKEEKKMQQKIQKLIPNITFVAERRQP